MEDPEEDPEEVLQPAPEEAESEAAESEQPDWLVYCTAAEAPLAKDLRKHAVELFGKDKARTLDSKTFKKQSGEMLRVACFNKKPATYRFLNSL